jgi:cell division transport system ATP-binding protein
VLLADEPTGNLDPALSWDTMMLFEQFNQVGVTVLIASHDLEMISRMKKRIITLREGRVLTHGGGDVEQ